MTRAELKEHCEKTCAMYEKHYINSYSGNKRYEEHKLVLELLKEIEKLEEYWDEEITLKELKERLNPVFPSIFS